jgi:hypothetical protein
MKVITKRSNKICSLCETELNIMKNFYRVGAQYYRSECKDCFRRVQRRRSFDDYRNNREKYLERNRRVRQKLYESIEKFKAAKPCAECNLPHPPHRLMFDRPDGKQKFNIVRDLKGVFAGTSAFQVVCANCVTDRAFKRLRVAHVMKAMKIK